MIRSLAGFSMPRDHSMNGHEEESSMPFALTPLLSRVLVIAGLLLLFVAPPAWAGYEEGKQAYMKEDYATVLKEWRSLAEEGDAQAQYGLA
jgi:hypothetical protein